MLEDHKGCDFFGEGADIRHVFSRATDFLGLPVMHGLEARATTAKMAVARWCCTGKHLRHKRRWTPGLLGPVAMAAVEGIFDRVAARCE